MSEHPKTFRTSDGFSYFFVYEKWVDFTLNPDAVQLVYDAGADGLSVDADGKPVEGEIIP